MPLKAAKTLPIESEQKEPPVPLTGGFILVLFSFAALGAGGGHQIGVAVEHLGIVGIQHAVVKGDIVQRLCALFHIGGVLVVLHGGNHAHALVVVLQNLVALFADGVLLNHIELVGIRQIHIGDFAFRHGLQLLSEFLGEVAGFGFQIQCLALEQLK